MIPLNDRWKKTLMTRDFGYNANLETREGS